MKGWAPQLLLCLVLSFSIWLIHDLSQTYSDVVNVSVIPHSNIEGRAEEALSEVTIMARCSAKGFRLVELFRRRKPVDVFFKPEDLHHLQDDIYAIAAGDVLKYASSIIGDGADMESIIGQEVQMRFKEEQNRKIAIRPVTVLSFRQQYMASSPLRTDPDSVVVYGDPSRLERLEAIYTAPVTLKDLRRNAHGTVKLEKLPGLRYSSDQVDYYLDVTRFVEIRREMPVLVRNVPAGVDFSIYPSVAEVVFKCSFPAGANPADRVSLYVDYRDFANTISGRCMVQADGLPESVIEMSVTPEVFDCVERTVE